MEIRTGAPRASVSVTEETAALRRVVGGAESVETTSANARLFARDVHESARPDGGEGAGVASPSAAASAAGTRVWNRGAAVVGPLSPVAAILQNTAPVALPRSAADLIAAIAAASSLPGRDVAKSVAAAFGVDVDGPRSQAFDTWMEAGALPYVFAALGPASLPLLQARPWRNEGAISTWSLAPSDVEAIVEAFQDGARDVYVNVVNALLANPNVDDAMRRRLVFSALVDERALPDQVSVEELSDRLSSSTHAHERFALGELLERRAIGLDALPAARRRDLVRALLADENVDVRIAAATMCWETEPSSARAQQDDVLKILEDPRILADERLRAIFSMGWSRETANLWGTPDSVRGQLQDQRVELVGRMLEHAPADADIARLAEEATSLTDYLDLATLTVDRVLASTTMPVEDKARALEKLQRGNYVLDRRLAPFVEFVVAHSAVAVEHMPLLVSHLAVHRYEPQYGRLKQDDMAEWKAATSTPDGLLAALREVATLNPRKRAFADALGLPSTPEPSSIDRLGEHVAALEDPTAYPHAMGSTVAALFERAADPDVPTDLFRRALDIGLPWAAKHYSYENAVPPQAFEQGLRLLGDKRAEPAQAAALLQRVFAELRLGPAWRAASVLEPLGISRTLIARLTASRPELLFNIQPTTRAPQRAAAPSRADVVREALRNEPGLSETTFAELARMLVDGDPAQRFAAMKQEVGWIDGVNPAVTRVAPEVVPFCQAIVDGVGYDELRRRFAATAPLSWQLADGVRAREDEAAALQALFMHPPIASPLWRGAFLTMVASAGRQLPQEFRETFLVDAMQPGYFTHTTADFSWDAEAALSSWQGDSLDFAAPGLVRHARDISTDRTGAKDFFALAPVLADRRLSPKIVADVLLTAVDRALQSANASVVQPPEVALIAGMLLTLRARPDLAPEDQAAILRASERLIAIKTFGAARVSDEELGAVMRKVALRVVSEAVKHETLAWKPQTPSVTKPHLFEIAPGLTAILEDPRPSGADAPPRLPAQMWLRKDATGLVSGPHDVGMPPRPPYPSAPSPNPAESLAVQQALWRPAEDKLTATPPLGLLDLVVGMRQGLTTDPPGSPNTGSVRLGINLGAVDLLKRAGVPLDPIQVHFGLPDYGGGGEFSASTRGPSPLPPEHGRLTVESSLWGYTGRPVTKLTNGWGEPVTGNSVASATVTLVWTTANGTRHELMSSSLNAESSNGRRGLNMALASAEKAGRFAWARAEEAKEGSGAG